MNGNSLKEKLVTDGVVLADLAKKLDITPQHLNSKLKAKSISIEFMESISKAINKSVYELKTNSKSDKKSGIPIYDVDFTAGNVTKFTGFEENVIGYIDMVGFRKCIAFVKIKGNSMFPTFTAGDLVGLEPISDITIIEYGQPFGIVTKTGQSLIKIIRKGKDNDNLILRSNNKDFDDIDIHKKDIQTLYKAHGPVRDSHY